MSPSTGTTPSHGTSILQRMKRTPNTAAPVIVIKYGNAIHTIRKYESRINGAKADVSKKRKAACPLGVAMLGMFVPVLIATARASN